MDKSQILEFILLESTKNRVKKAFLRTITAKNWNIQSKDIDDMWSEVYIKLVKLKKWKFRTESQWIGYLIVIVNNYFKDAYSKNKKTYNEIIQKEDKTFSIDNKNCPITDLDDPDWIMHPVLNIITDIRTKHIISILQSIYSDDKIVNNIIYWSTISIKESGKKVFSKQNLELIKRIMSDLDRNDKKEKYIKEYEQIYRIKL